MNTNIVKEIAIVAALAVLALLLANPMNFWMPKMGEALLTALVVLVVAAFATLYWREQAHDEREALLRARSGRIAFLLGSVVLTVGIVVEFVTMEYANPWLLGALVAMVAAKAWANIYGDQHL